MILLNRGTPTSRAQQIRGELAEGFGHLRSATSSAAAGAAERLAPHIDHTLTVVGLRKKPASRWPWVAGAVVAGAVLGAVAVIVAMRRNREQVGELLMEEQGMEEEPFLAEEPIPSHTTR